MAHRCQLQAQADGRRLSQDVAPRHRQTDHGRNSARSLPTRNGASRSSPTSSPARLGGRFSGSSNDHGIDGCTVRVRHARFREIRRRFHRWTGLCRLIPSYCARRSRASIGTLPPIRTAQGAALNMMGETTINMAKCRGAPGLIFLPLCQHAQRLDRIEKRLELVS